MGRSLARITVAAALVFAALLVALAPKVRLRLHLVTLQLRGKLPAVTARDLPHLLRPGSGFDLETLDWTRNPTASLTVPPLLGNRDGGAHLFESHCAQCHGARGEGGMAPSLVEGPWVHAGTDWGMYQVLRDGLPGTAMKAAALPFDDAWRVIAHVRSLRPGIIGSGNAGAPTAAVIAPVTADEIAAAEQADSEWLSYNGGWSGRRNRIIPELTSSSVRTMRLAWVSQLPADPAISQSTPIAARGLLLVTTALEVIALDQQSGAVAWRFHRELPREATLCCYRAIRGLGILGTSVFVGTLDAHLLALDLTTGRLLWDTEVASPADGFSITGAPFVADGRVLVGVSGGEFSVRGFLDAYDPATGKRVWRFYTVPAQGEPGSSTWGEGTIPRGGGTWVPGAYDPERHLLLWGVGNPSPEFAPEKRAGTNLQTNSVIALDVRTGVLAWSYQFTPGDSHDWDAAQTPVLVDAAWQGRMRPLVLWANRNAFFYVLDRETGEFLRATAFAKQTWNDGFDAKGRPRQRPSAQSSVEGSVVYPGYGATNWWSPSYSDRLGLLFVAVQDGGSVFFRDVQPEVSGGMSVGGRAVSIPGEPAPFSIVALDLASGAVRWKTPAPDLLDPSTGGLLSVSEQIVLAGQGHTFFALDARTGRRVWQVNLGGVIKGAPIVFRTQRRPRVAIVAGSVLFVFEVPKP